MLCRWRHRVAARSIKGRVLDIGCGTNQLIKSHGDGIGVDVHGWDGVDIIVDNTADLPFEDRGFDTVTIIAALNHIPNRKEVLLETNRLLRDGGRIVLTMIPPRLSTIWHFLRRPWDADQHERGMKDGEVYGMTVREVDDLLGEAGFENIHHERFMLGVNCLTTAEKPLIGKTAPSEDRVAA
jgi:ubiquinone/menaquinone biosynthesis C-methylase UbiE